MEGLESRSYFAGVGQGLVAEYFADKSFASLALARHDATVNFDWAGAPAAGLPADGYSVRWTGQVLADFSQNYTFYAKSAGGVRVWLNGVKIIDHWTTHANQEVAGSIALTAGEYYPISVEYREEGTGSVRLSWSSASTPKQVIPKSQLYRVGTGASSGGWLEGHIGPGTGSVSGSTTSGINIKNGAVSPPVSPPPVSPPPVSPPVSPPPVSPPAAGININFQPATATPVVGYLIDNGDLYGARNGQSYGWTISHTDTVVDRELHANQLLDTNIGVKSGGKWELAVPNGRYTVTVGVGDAGAATNNNVYVEKVSLFNYVPLPANAFQSRTIAVDVADGKLTLATGSAASGLTHFTYIQVAADASSPPTVPPVSPPPVTLPSLSGLQLLDASTDLVIGAFTSGATLDISSGKTYSVVAEPGSGVKSVVFVLDGVKVRTEGFAPYSIAGETGPDFAPWVPSAGNHTLVVTPFAGSNGTGQAGTAISVSFSASVAPVQAGGLMSAAAGAGASAGSFGGSLDSYHYLYRMARGNAELTARLDSLTPAGEGGLIARGGLTVGGAFVGLTRDANSVSLEYSGASGGTVLTAGSRAVSGPVYLRLVRDGNQYAGYFSSTGAAGTWQFVGAAGVNLGTFNYLGIASAVEGTTARYSAVKLKTSNPLGGNLNAMSDRVQDLPFVDLVKTTRGFFNASGRVNAATGLTDFATTDANGWPTENFFFDVVNNTEWGVPAEAGTYPMSFSGPAGVTVTATPGVTLQKLGYLAGVHTYNVIVPAGKLKLGFAFANTAGQVKNIRVLQPGYSLSNAPTFTAKYLNLLRTTNPGVLRLMDWTKTNNNPVANWSERNTPSQATQAKSAGAGELQPVKGIAWEYAIQLANQLGKNIWVNVPAKASDDYVRNLANLLRTQLNPDLNIYLEYTNEAWNLAFSQANWLREEAVAEVFADKAAGRASQLNYDNLPVDTTKPGGTNPNAYAWAERYYARRTKQITDIFRQAWLDAGQPDPVNSRVRTILGAQIATMSRTTNHLKFLIQFYGEPKKFLYGVGVAPYANVNGRPQSTAAEVIASLSKSIDSFNFASPVSLAKSWGLELLAYEIGFDTFGPDNIAAKRTASLDARMQEMVNRFVTRFYAAGGNLANWFTVGARSYSSPYGTWTLTESLDVLNSPKIKGFQQVRDAAPVATKAHGVFA